MLIEFKYLQLITLRYLIMRVNFSCSVHLCLRPKTLRRFFFFFFTFVIFYSDKLWDLTFWLKFRHVESFEVFFLANFLFALTYPSKYDKTHIEKIIPKKYFNYTNTLSPLVKCKAWFKLVPGCPSLRFQVPSSLLLSCFFKTNVVF